ncbi:c1q globular head domain containing protein [uncultured Mediterranean phage uvMED]|nr:c1q globular head domain containing protein [uncultured Mediterranean phage uvMED]
MSSSYIGRSVDAINNISTLDNLSFNGSDATFNLTQNSVAFVPVSADALQIQIDGVIQSGNYTVSGSTVTFDFTPSGSSVCNGIRHYGVGIITSVSDGAVTTAKLGADSVNATKIADDSISDEHLDITAITGQTAITSLADTDKFLVSDASDSGNLKYVEKQYLGGGVNTPMFSVRQTGTVNVSDNTYTKVAWNSELVDTDNAFASDKFVVPSGKSGKYFLYVMLLGQGNSGETLSVYYLNIYKNGSRIAMNEGDFRGYNIRKSTQTVTTVQDLSEGDYLEVYVGIDVTGGAQASYSGGDYQGMFGGYKLIT